MCIRCLHRLLPISVLAQQLENVALTKKNKELEGSVDDLRHTVDKLQKEVKDVDNRLNSKVGRVDDTSSQCLHVHE